MEVLDRQRFDAIQDCIPPSPLEVLAQDRLGEILHDSVMLAGCLAKRFDSYALRFREGRNRDENLIHLLLARDAGNRLPPPENRKAVNALAPFRGIARPKQRSTRESVPSRGRP